MNKKHIAIVAITAVLTFGLAIWGVLVPYEEVMGVLAAPGSTVIAASDQPGVAQGGSVTINLVEAPRDAFVVVHQLNAERMPGMMVGYARVERGETRDLKVELDPEVPLTDELIAAVHVDAGVRGVLEFDMDNMHHSPDRPIFIDGEEVAVVFSVAGVR